MSAMIASAGPGLAKPYTSNVVIAFGSATRAGIVKSCLEVDEELQPLKINKTLCVQDGDLHVLFEATDLKLLRVAISSFMDMAIVATKTLLEFDTSA